MIKNIAIISPNENAYSESFIQAHKKIKGNIYFYYKGHIPTLLENYGTVTYCKECLRTPFTTLKRILRPSLLLYPKSFNLKKRLLAQSFKKNKINYVLAEYGPCAVEIMDICEYLNIPLIAHFHGYDISVKDILDENKETYPKLFNIAYKIIVVSKVMEKKVIELGCPKEKILYNPCGPDDSYFNIRPHYNTNNIISIGRFVDKKSPYYIILAFKSVLKEIPDAKLTMIGNGLLWECCKNIAAYLKIEQNINFIGFTEHKNIQQYLEDSSLFIQSSITSISGDQEGTPVSVMEASLAGLPIVSTLHAGIPDVILNNETGILLKEHDIEGFSNAIVKLLKNKKEAKRLGDNGKQYIYKNFKLSISIQRIENIIYNIV